MMSKCLAKFQRMGQQQQQGTVFTGVVYAIVAAQLMKMIYMSRTHQATDTEETDSASFLYYHYVSCSAAAALSAYISNITYLKACLLQQCPQNVHPDFSKCELLS